MRHCVTSKETKDFKKRQGSQLCWTHVSGKGDLPGATFHLENAVSSSADLLV